MSRSMLLAPVLVTGVLIALACGGGPDEPSPPDALDRIADVPEPDANPEPVPARTLPPLVEHDGERPSDCTLDPSGLTPRFAADQGDGITVTVTRDDNGLVETFTLPDGTPVRSVQGGCYDYGITETYVLAAPPDDLLAEARAVAARIRRPSDLEGDTLLKGLQTATSIDDEYGFIACSPDMTCSVTSEGPVVKVGLSFSL